MHYKLTIPERLQDLRKERHLTLEQLAEQTGLSRSALGKYESDDYKDISPFAIATLAEFNGVSAAYLRGVAENKNRPAAELQARHLRAEMVGRVQESDCFSHVQHEDLDGSGRDIREAHRKDRTTADAQPSLEDVKGYLSRP